jgi:hypothetical protein|tara:strand:+ start:10948 stop:11118 length:171 start_codon:yes stop_codon:yes gene_type:complete
MAIRKAKIYITLEVDTEDYPTPVDEQLEKDVQDQIEAFIYDVDGFHLNKIKVLMGD